MYLILLALAAALLACGDSAGGWQRYRLSHPHFAGVKTKGQPGSHDAVPDDWWRYIYELNRNALAAE